MTEEQQPQPSFPQPNMPRMGRRNAIAPSLKDSQYQPDDTGAFSPANLLNRASTTTTDTHRSSSIDRADLIAHELAQEIMNMSQIESRPLILTPLTPLKPTTASSSASATAFNTSVLNEWKKLQDSSPKLEGIQTILREDNAISVKISPTTSQSHSQQQQQQQKKRSKTRQTRPRSTSLDRERGGEGGPLIKAIVPWKHALTDEKPLTKAEERRKIFEAFNMTSAEPPDTPKVSESKIKKDSTNSKKKNNKIASIPSSSESEESLVFPLGFKYKPETYSYNNRANKGPYSTVQAKVNTRWNKWEDLQNWKLSSLLNRSSILNDKPSSIKSASLSPSSRGRSGGRLSRSYTPTKSTTKATKTKTTKNMLSSSTSRPTTPNNPPPASKKTRNASRLVANYPAAETVKDHPVSDQLPLTIGPRYNHKKAWKMISAAGAQNKAEMAQDATNATRLFGNLQASPIQKQKLGAISLQQQLQLQQHEALGVGIAAAGGVTGSHAFKSTFYNLERINNGRNKTLHNNVTTPTATTTNAVRRDNSLLNFHLVTRKKSPLFLTTIQAPPSPFLTSNISVPSQLNDIPINGEISGGKSTKKEGGKTGGKKKESFAASSSSKKETSAGGNAGAGTGTGTFLKSQRATTSVSLSPANNKKEANAKKETFLLKKQDRKLPLSKSGKSSGSRSVAGAANGPILQLLNPPLSAAMHLQESLNNKNKNIKSGNGKVVPALGKAPNKYNNIYIGPYSGSDSDGEVQNSKNRK